VNALKNIERVTFFTPFSPHWSCSIGTFHIEGYTSRELVKILLDKYKIHVTTADKEAIKGIRVTPSIATTEEEIYTFIRAIKEIVETAP
jgi:selenocysteine lyase/cysteine desulfurase